MKMSKISILSEHEKDNLTFKSYLVGVIAGALTVLLIRGLRYILN